MADDKDRTAGTPDERDAGSLEAGLEPQAGDVGRDAPDTTAEPTADQPQRAARDDSTEPIAAEESETITDTAPEAGPTPAVQSPGAAAGVGMQQAADDAATPAPELPTANAAGASAPEVAERRESIDLSQQDIDSAEEQERLTVPGEDAAVAARGVTDTESPQGDQAARKAGGGCLGALLGLGLLLALALAPHLA